MPVIDLQTVSLFYEEQGAGEPLLLLHGLGSNGRSWEYQQEAFAEEYRVIVPDVRGHGRSGGWRGHVERWSDYLLDLDAVWAEVNPQMLYGKHLGLRGVVKRLIDEGDEKYRKLEAVVDELKALARDGAMRARAVWRFFPAEAEGARLTLRDPASGEVAATLRSRATRSCHGIFDQIG